MKEFFKLLGSIILFWTVGLVMALSILATYANAQLKDIKPIKPPASNEYRF